MGVWKRSDAVCSNIDCEQYYYVWFRDAEHYVFIANLLKCSSPVSRVYSDQGLHESYDVDGTTFVINPSGDNPNPGTLSCEGDTLSINVAHGMTGTYQRVNSTEEADALKAMIETASCSAYWGECFIEDQQPTCEGNTDCVYSNDCDTTARECRYPECE